MFKPIQISAISESSCFVITDDGSVWKGVEKIVDGVEKFIWKRLPMVQMEELDRLNPSSYVSQIPPPPPPPPLSNF